jgi:hypothetical protein
LVVGVHEQRDPGEQLSARRFAIGRLWRGQRCEAFDRIGQALVMPGMTEL